MHRTLHEPEPEQVAVERDRPPRVRGDEGDVVEPEGVQAGHGNLTW